MKYDRELLGEAFHAGLRKFCDSDESAKAWRIISAMPDRAWARFMDRFSSLMQGKRGSHKMIRNAAITAASHSFQPYLSALTIEDWKGLRDSLSYAKKSA